jgi:RNA polymerase sigma-70 factor (ECF subfamily)
LLKDASTDTSLLQRAKAQDPEAWNKLVAWSGPLVFAWCRKAGVTKEDREDVFQEVFLKVYKSLARFQHGQAGQTFRGWLLVITRNTILDFAQQRLQRPKAAGSMDEYRGLLHRASESLSDSALTHREARTQGFARALALLQQEFSEGAWKAFWRTAVDGLSATEAGVELGMSPQAVRKAKSRVLARLREEFRELLD